MRQLMLPLIAQQVFLQKCVACNGCSVTGMGSMVQASLACSNTCRDSTGCMQDVSQQQDQTPPQAKLIL